MNFSSQLPPRRFCIRPFVIERLLSVIGQDVLLKFSIQFASAFQTRGLLHFFLGKVNHDVRLPVVQARAFRWRNMRQG